MPHYWATPSVLLQILDWYSSKLWLFTQLLSGKFKIIQGSRGWEWIVFGPLAVHHFFRPACLSIPNCLDLQSVPRLLVLLKRSSFDIHFETLATTILFGSDFFAHHKTHAPKANKPLSEGSWLPASSLQFLGPDSSLPHLCCRASSFLELTWNLNV